MDQPKEAPAYTLPPKRTHEDFDRLLSFIKARVEPLRDAVHFQSEEFRAIQGLLDLVLVLRGGARYEVDKGNTADAELLHFYLVQVARKWSDHPDFVAEWS